MSVKYPTSASMFPDRKALACTLHKCKNFNNLKNHVNVIRAFLYSHPPKPTHFIFSLIKDFLSLFRRSSLEICATDEKRGRTRTLSLCKVQAMRCLGHQYTLAEDSACQWPHRSSTACPHCTLWETCDGEGL